MCFALNISMCKSTFASEHAIIFLGKLCIILAAPPINHLDAIDQFPQP